MALRPANIGCAAFQDPIGNADRRLVRRGVEQIPRLFVDRINLWDADRPNRRVLSRRAIAFRSFKPYTVIDVQPAGDDVGGKNEVARSRFRLAKRYEYEPFVERMGRLLVLEAQPECIRRCRLDLQRDETARFGVLSQHVGSLDTTGVMLGRQPRRASSPATKNSPAAPVSALSMKRSLNDDNARGQPESREGMSAVADPAIACRTASLMELPESRNARVAVASAALGALSDLPEAVA